MSNLEAVLFEGRLQSSVETAKAVLGKERSSGLVSADQASHSYQDKYILANQLTNSAGAALWDTLTCLGVSTADLQTLAAWAKSSTVTLRFDTRQSCQYLRTAAREEESPTRVETEVSLGMLAGKFSTKVATKITEYFYEFTTIYSLLAYRGVGAQDADKLPILTRTASQELVHRQQRLPYPETISHVEDLEISFPLGMLNVEQSFLTFGINRNHNKCFTPVRNPDIDQSLHFFSRLRNWCRAVDHYFAYTTLGVIRSCGKPKQEVPDSDNVSNVRVFVPLLTFFRTSDRKVDGGEEVFPAAEAAEESASPTVGSTVSQFRIQQPQVEETALTATAAVPSVALNDEDIGMLIDEHLRSLQQHLSALSSVYRSAAETKDNLFSLAEARLLLVVRHLTNVADKYQAGIVYIESMILAQLIRAIGREIAPVDFSLYMSFHYRKLYRTAVRPGPFSFAVRRSALHAPEGSLRIEMQTDDAKSFASNGGYQPIETLLRSTTASSSMMMSMAINAATRIFFGGERHVHGWLSHSFTDSPAATLRLAATARQFSSFILVLGQISSASTFEPKFAVIIQNKEELLIPLLLETIPNAQQFRDAIESLSPEQQRFAQAYRSMQLESTLFGMVLLQIKPQLEKVLHLPPDSLTKEIKLTQDLMKLFMEHQIPADLLSFDEDASEAARTASTRERVREVQGHVGAMMDMLKEAKEGEIREKNREREYMHGQPQMTSTNHDLFSQSTLEVDEEDCEPAYERSARSYSSYSRKSSFRTESKSRAVPKSRGGGSNFLDMLMKSSAPACPPPTGANELANSAGRVPPPPPAPVASASVESVAVSEVVESPASVANPEEVSSGSDKQQNANKNASEEEEVEEGEGEETSLDITQFPKLFDSAFDRLDSDHAVRPMIIKSADSWQRLKQKDLLTSAKQEQLQGEQLTKERNAAFDLLDAITRSGALPIEHATLHVLIGANHCFGDSLMNSIVQRNMNPIEVMERSSLIMATTLLDAPKHRLVQTSQLQRLLQ